LQGLAIKINIGDVFGERIVIGINKKIRNYNAVLCKCICGKEDIIKSTYLKNGHARCCIKCSQHKHRKHGHAINPTPTYQTWTGMFSRCNNLNDPAYVRYGKRGIKICDWWFSFENFLSDMGVRPKNLTLDRIDNDGNYEPGNCRWATAMEQAQNTSRNIKIEIDGKIKVLSEWTRVSGVCAETILYRLNNGWPSKKAVFADATAINHRMIELDGEWKQLCDWAKISPVHKRTIAYRIKMNWPIKEAIFSPPHFKLVR